MGFYYEIDWDRHVERLKFRCACGHPEAMRTKVRKPSGGTYETEFAECVLCRLMYHWPLPLDDFRQAPIEAPAHATRQMLMPPPKP